MIGLMPHRSSPDRIASSRQEVVSSPRRLNVFQRVMRDWGELHPYNAVHTYKLAGPLQVEQLREAIRQTYEHNGLGIAEFDPDGRTYRFGTDSSPTVEVLAGGKSPERQLATQIAAELNRPFERPRCRPFRFSAIDAGPESHYITAAYDHWVADSVTARLVLRHVLGRYCELEIPENEDRLAFYPGTYRDAFAHRLGGLHCAAAVWNAARQCWANRSAAQVPYSSVTHMAVDYRLERTAPGTVDRLLRFARSLGATVHDVILAVQARALAAQLPRRVLQQARGISLGTIVDTRNEVMEQENMDQTGGMFLSYYAVQVRPGQSDSLADLVRQVAAQTGPIKQRRAYINAIVNMQVLTQLWHRMKKARRPYLMRNAMPLTGGVSNVVVRDDWIATQGQGRILDYLRGSPTGPMLPLVLAPTTFQNQLNVGVTYRVTGFSTAKIDGLVNQFLEEIENPAAVGARQTLPMPAKKRAAA